MCMVSVLSAYGQDRIDQNSWTRPQFDQFKNLVDQTAKLDEALGEPDCEDSEKSKWMDEVEARLKALESAALRSQS